MRPDTLRALVRAALDEDLGAGDWTTRWTVGAERHGRARIVAKQDGVVAGIDAAAEVFRSIDPGIAFRPLVAEGAAVGRGDAVAGVDGPAAGILTGERTALNFLQRLSGVATLTRRFVDAVEGTGAAIVDTRKTTPGWRALEKAAVRAGGGGNHRHGLYDMVLLKENHIAAAGGITAALERVRRANRDGLPVEVEVRDLAELEEALAGAPDRILLDNMDPPLLARAVQRVRATDGRRPLLEASGNVSLATVRAVAETGVDLISVGALTHSAPALDLSLLLEIA
jgi:nicotinate-nucleotide pyrophosphorylase (carboxylating)